MAASLPYCAAELACGPALASYLIHSSHISPRPPLPSWPSP